jgi:hypothetical protein
MRHTPRIPWIVAVSATVACQSSTPDPCAPEPNARVIALAAHNTDTWTVMALRSDGTAFCWGNDLDGLCGASVVPGPVPFAKLQIPTEGVAVRCAKQVALGVVGAAVTRAGQVDVWGTANGDQFGDGVQFDSSIGRAKAVPNLAGVVQLATNSNVTALRSDGAVLWWGERTDTLNPVEVPFPVPVVLPSRAVQVIDSCFLLDTGDVYCMGRNTFGEIGDGTTMSSAVPVRVHLPEPAIEIQGAYPRRCAILASKKVACWGDTNFLPEYIPGVSGFDHLRFGSRSGWCVFAAGAQAACYDEVSKILTQFTAFANILDMVLGDDCVLTTDHQVHCIGPAPNPNLAYVRIPDPRESMR